MNSNVVQSTVSQVGAFELTGSHTQAGALGSTVYVQHTLVNRGNGTDQFLLKVAEGIAPGRFAQIAIYHDANGTGLPSEGLALCSSAVGAARHCEQHGVERALAGNGAVFRFLVAYTLPAHVPQQSSADSFSTARVLAEPANKSSDFYATYAPPAVHEQIDTITFTAGSAFVVTKAIAAPAQAPMVGAWPAALDSGKASPPGCPAEWSATLLSSNPSCAYTVLTLTYTNTGRESGDLSLQETLPQGFTYVRGSAVWSGMMGAPLADDNLSIAQGDMATRIHYAYAPNTSTLNATVVNVGPNSSGAISYVVLVNSTAQPGMATTTSFANYFSQGCNALLPGSSPTNCGGVDMSLGLTPPAVTNAVPFHVLPTYGVVAAATVSTVPDGAVVPPKIGENLVELARITAGGSVQFTNVITNTGNATDTYALAVRSAEGDVKFPEGTRYQVLKANGLTPLADTNGDGAPDTGPLTPGSSMIVIVQVQLPFLANLGTGPMDALLTATSLGSVNAGSFLVSDSVWNRVNAIVGSLVDLTGTAAGSIHVVRDDGPNGSSLGCIGGRNCDVGQGPSMSPTITARGYPGIGVVFNVFLRNNDTINQSYSLSADLPSGWGVKFLSGENAHCEDSELVQPVPVGAGLQMVFGACITPISTATLGESNFILTARSSAASSNGNVVSDSVTYAANLDAAPVRSISVSPISMNSIANVGGFVTQSVVLTNSGNQSCVSGGNAQMNVAAVLDSAATDAGWRTALYYDRNSNGLLDADDPMLSPVSSGSGNFPGESGANVFPFPAGAVVKLLLKTHVSASSPPQSSATVTISMTDLSAAACPIPTVAYNFVANNESLRVLKTQVVDAACTGDASLLANLSTDSVPVAPGQCLIYQVTFNNDGSAPLLDVSVSSGVPVYTSYAELPGVQPGSPCESSRLSGVPVEFSTQSVGGAVHTVSCGSATNSLAPSGFVKLTYSVKVDQ